MRYLGVKVWVYFGEILRIATKISFLTSTP